MHCSYQNEGEVRAAAGERDGGELPVGGDRGGEAARRHRHRHPPGAALARRRRPRHVSATISTSFEVTSANERENCQLSRQFC